MEPGFATWLQRFRHDEYHLAWRDLAGLAAEDEWEDGHGYAHYFPLIPRAAEDALKSAWQRYIIEIQYQGQAVSHACRLAFTSADLRGKPRQHVAGYILRKIECEAPVCEGCKLVRACEFEPLWCRKCRQAWYGAVFEVVACCAERGYSDAQTVYLVSKTQAARRLWPGLSITRYRQTIFYLRKLRRLHPHPGRTCESARCPSTPEWMARYARTG